jgi:nucleotide-binding universal stress UspA family protein
MIVPKQFTDVVEALANLARALASLPLALLPRRHWEWFPRLPIRAAAVPSAFATLAVGLYAGGRGFMAYARHAADSVNTAMLDAAARQLQGQGTAGPPVTTLSSQAFSALSPFAFVLATPLGWLASYLVISGVLRAVSAGVDQPIGDPLLTGIDALASRRRQRALESSRRLARERQEGPEVADRLITGEACGLPAADLVVIASRRKGDWSAGTIVVTPDAWYRLAEPFDVTLPQGVRTAYPLTKLETTEVLRRSVSYTLPPLQRAPVQLRRP